MNKRYICIGENFKDGFKVGFGYCGEVKTLEQWTIQLLGNKAVVFFKGDSVSYVIKYILIHTGKRLKKVVE